MRWRAIVYRPMLKLYTTLQAHKNRIKRKVQRLKYGRYGSPSHIIGTAARGRGAGPRRARRSQAPHLSTYAVPAVHGQGSHLYGAGDTAPLLRGLVRPPEPRHRPAAGLSAELKSAPLRGPRAISCGVILCSDMSDCSLRYRCMCTW